MSSQAPEPKHAERFFINVLWSWLSVGTSLFIGFYLTRLLIRKLTAEQYGIWVLAFSLIEYISLFDMGFRSAIVVFLAKYRLQNDHRSISEIISTAFAYFLGIAVFLLTLALTLAPFAYRAFNISPASWSDCSFLFSLVGLIWAGSIISSIFLASLEAYQAFKTSNKIAVVTLFFRSFLLLTVLFLGYGLKALGICAVIAQLAGWIMSFIAFRRLLPEVKIRREFVLASRWKQMASYGFKSVSVHTGTLFLSQGPPLVVGHYLPAPFVGYYSVPFRLLNYLVDLISRIGAVTAAKTAELSALGRREQVASLGTRLNRYCFAVFLPLSVFLAIYGKPLLTLWLPRQEFVEQCAPLLPIFTVSVSLAVSAQYNSTAMLFGMAKHGSFAISVIIESFLSLAGMALALPRYGIFGAACVSAGLTIVNRGLITPLIVCRNLDYSYLKYMRYIYARPLACVAPVIALGAWMRSFWLPGQTIVQLIAAAGLVIPLGLILEFAVCVEREHRTLLLTKVRQWMGKPADSAVESDPEFTNAGPTNQ
jgi:O-antigen/teichoic acid export membrane protein